MASNFRLHAVIEGHVQGVGFRMFVLEQASRLELTGWVRNTSNGDVEVCAEGDRESLDKLYELLEKGPRSAYVIQVSQEWEPARGEFRSFEVLRTF